MDQQIFEQVDAYITSEFDLQDALLTATEQSIVAAGMPEHSISPVQGRMLQTLAKLCNAQRILEIGTLGGYSTIWLGRSLPENGRLITLEVNPDFAAVAQQNIDNAQLSDKVDIKVGKALAILPQLEAEENVPFDMVFIDADKPPYTEYFDWAVKLCRPGALIVADNVVREGKVLATNSTDAKVLGVQRFNKALSKRTDVTATILQTIGIKEYDGMAIAVVN